MRILFLTNFYPPFERGGQGRSCQQVVEGLRQRGYQTAVLTSMHGTKNVPKEENGVYRWLYLEMDFSPWQQGLIFFTGRKKREKQNLERLSLILDQFKPDLIFIWGMWDLSRQLPALCEANFPGRVLYRFADYWPTLPSQQELYWRTTGRKWYSQPIKKILAHLAFYILSRDKTPLNLRFEHAICVSAATRNILVEAGIAVSHARIIHTGLDPALYSTNGHQQAQQPNAQPEMINLLYAGRMSADKGVGTLIEAMAKLVNTYQVNNLKLGLAGTGSKDYISQLKSAVQAANLQSHVSFLGLIPYGDMPKLFAEFNVLVVPSIWQEPFARTVLEGMICGLVVVATPTGGTSEILEHGQNGLLFTANDAEDLAQKILCLINDEQLRFKLAEAGRRTVLEKFTATRMLDQIEHHINEIMMAAAQN